MARVQTADGLEPTSAFTEDPPDHVQGRLRERWGQRVHELVTLPRRPLDDGMAERHRIFSLMLMALVRRYWNGNKRGQEGEYPWRVKQRLDNGIYEGGVYLGHNIACVAVDGAGEVIDFDFNHNEILSSSAEHAESRLVRRVFSFAQLYSDWETKDPPKPAEPVRTSDYSNTLSNVTIYTSLESCSQCAGIMALGKVREVVYLHRDTGMYLIGNILYNLTEDKLRAPYPTAGEAFGFEYFHELNDAFEEFRREVGAKPFHIAKSPTERLDVSASVTSFLCTDVARDIYDRAKAEFDSMSVRHPDYKPIGETTTPEPRVLTNAEALDHARRFLAYAAAEGRRGTPHKL